LKEIFLFFSPAKSTNTTTKEKIPNKINDLAPKTLETILNPNKTIANTYKILTLIVLFLFSNAFLYSFKPCNINNKLAIYIGAPPKWIMYRNGSIYKLVKILVIIINY